MDERELRKITDKYGVIARIYEQDGKTEYLLTVPLYKAKYSRWRKKYKVKKLLTFKRFYKINEVEDYLLTIPKYEVELNIAWLQICREIIYDIFGDDTNI